MGACTIGIKGYIFCGYKAYSPLIDNDEYNASGDSWLSKNSAPSPARHLLTAVTLLGYGHAIGGYDSGSVFGDNDRYDSGADGWTSKTSVTATHSWSVVEVSDKAYLIGGIKSPSGPQTACIEYDSVNDTYTNKTPMSSTRYSAAAGGSNGKAYVYYGVEGGIGRTKTCDEYNPSNNSWTDKADGLDPARYELAGFTI